MKRFLGVAVAAVGVVAAGLGGPARGDDQEVKAVLDKGIKALGGEDTLKTCDAVTWKTKGVITFGENGHEYTAETTVKGLDRYRGEFEGEFQGNKFKGVTVVAGDKGWRKFGENQMELEGDALANEKRTIYLNVVPMTLLPLKDKAFKVESGAEEKVDGKPAAVLKVTGPDGKTFTLYLDRDSGLPVKEVATVAGFGGDTFEQETTYGDYKDLGGIKKATKVERKRDGQTFMKETVTDLKPLDKVDADLFTEPK